MKHKKGYHVWLYGDCYWHRTLRGAGKRLRYVQNWCTGEHAQCVDVATGGNLTDEAWSAI